jgi:hypothetical protein
MPNFSTTVKMKFKYIMMKIYNPQILFWVQTQNPRIYEITISIYGIWLPLWHLQTFHAIEIRPMFCNIMAFEDKCYVWDFISNLYITKHMFDVFHIMMKIYNPQILFWVQTQNPRIYEITILRKLMSEKYFNGIIRWRPRRLHINMDWRESLLEQELLTLPELLSSPPVLVGFLLLDL